MAVGILAAIANGWLTGLSGWFVQLHTADPGATGVGGNCVGTVAGTRKASTMNASSGGAISQSAGGSWVTWDGGSVTITHISCWTTVGSGAGAGTYATTGTCQFTGALTAGKAITNGDTFNLTSLSVTITPIAA